MFHYSFIGKYSEEWKINNANQILQYVEKIHRQESLKHGYTLYNVYIAIAMKIPKKNLIYFKPTPAASLSNSYQQIHQKAHKRKNMVSARKQLLVFHQEINELERRPFRANLRILVRVHEYTRVSEKRKFTRLVYHYIEKPPSSRRIHSPAYL